MRDIETPGKHGDWSDCEATGAEGSRHRDPEPARKHAAIVGVEEVWTPEPSMVCVGSEGGTHVDVAPTSLVRPVLPEFLAIQKALPARGVGSPMR